MVIKQKALIPSLFNELQCTDTGPYNNSIPILETISLIHSEVKEVSLKGVDLKVALIKRCLCSTKIVTQIWDLVELVLLKDII